MARRNSPETIAKRSESLRRWREANPDKKPTKNATDGRFKGKIRQPMPGVYAIVNSNNGKIYIGSSKDPYKRYLMHFSGLRRNQHPSKRMLLDFQHDEFHFEIIEIVQEKSIRLQREQFWMDFFKPEYNVSRLVHSAALSQEERRILGIGVRKLKVTNVGRA